MHDTFLFKKISDSLEEICRGSRIRKITRIEVGVHEHSHVNSTTLLENLLEYIPHLVDRDTEVVVETEEDVKELTALIKSIEGLYDEAILT